ncbi:uncharacterized protein LOC129989507 [Argiope bruennichi]|uniref:Uncharacterized protein n=1 Tax=Argiope bruennichi TaxID=94029 RepID=A0A8T0FUY4_ARGBR|nr:uncharacterized protein LOC129989507 [Argiope bruennichi]KAF8794008.1 hypothetical protein HNY73_002033 [Argiope bruennichi]
MFCSVNSRKITNCVLLSCLSFDFVFSAATETAQRLEDDVDGGIFDGIENEDINSGDSRILHDDYFRFTTKRRYIWDDYTIPTPDPTDHKDTSSFADFGSFMLQVIIPIVIPGLVIFFLFLLVKRLIAKKCCATESNSHSSTPSGGFTAVHRPPRERDGTPDASSGAQTRADLFNELGSNQSRVYSIRVDISVANSASASSSQGVREAGDVFTEKPPDYSTVTLSDLINPTKPAFPVVKKGNETPPPEYGKENQFFK